MLHDARLASEFADEMLKRGIYVIGFSFPVRPPPPFLSCMCVCASCVRAHVCVPVCP